MKNLTNFFKIFKNKVSVSFESFTLFEEDDQANGTGDDNNKEGDDGDDSDSEKEAKAKSPPSSPGKKGSKPSSPNKGARAGQEEGDGVLVEAEDAADLD